VPKISIIVPVYKIAESYLRQCIESLMKQSLHEIEIILVNDGSPDHCPEICDEYAKKDFRINVIHQKNEGVSVARNTGINWAHGEYVSFVDGDDWCELEMCEKLYAYAKENSSDIVISSYTRERKGHHSFHIWERDIPFLSQEQHEWVMETSIFPQSIQAPTAIMVWSVWSKLYRLDFIRQNRLYFFNGIDVFEDDLFNVSAYIKAASIAYLHQPYYHYRINHSNTAMVKYHTNFHEQQEQLIQLLSALIQESSVAEKLYPLVQARCIHTILHLLPQYFFHPQRNKSFHQTIVELRHFLESNFVKKSLEAYDSRYFSIAEKAAIYLCKKKYVFLLYLISMKWTIQRKLGLWRT